MTHQESQAKFLKDRLARHERTTYRPIETPFMAAVRKERGHG